MTRKKIVTIAFALASACAFAVEIDVPDLESRIRNSGAAIPQAAMPALAKPAPAPLPTPVPEAAAPTVAPIAAESAPTPAVAAAPEASVPAESGTPPVVGHVAVAAGRPGLIGGNISVSRESGTEPGSSLGFAVDFSHDSVADFGPSSGFSNPGYYSKKTSLSAALFGGPDGSSWKLSADVSERTDGLQGQNAEYSSLTRRDMAFLADSGSIRLGDGPFAWSAALSGDVFSSGADKPGTLPPTTAIPGYAGYSLDPSLSISFAQGAFKALLTGRYSYNAVVESPEAQAGRGTLSLSYAIGQFLLAADVSAHGDGDDGFLAPFSAAVVWENADIPLRRVSLAGGLSVDRVSCLDLADENPFILLSGKPVWQADWNGSLSARLVPFDALSLDAGAVFRASLPGRGMLAVSDDLAPGNLYAVSRLERKSLVASARGNWEGEGWNLAAEYEGEWLDRAWRDSLHSLTASGTVRDSSPRSIWSASASSRFFLDAWDMPEISLTGTFRPAKALAISLLVSDLVPLATGTRRTLKGPYVSSLGAVALSARIDF
ncbi:MAG TPA: hypothetical protein PKO22_09490 [Treponemataceae bacterium]|nr:hypothetical protein [Treponemataceae bacterium]